MCLGIPGRIIETDEHTGSMRMGKVDFGEVIREACLAYVPEARADDYVIFFHAGFAISQVDEEEAQETFRLLADAGILLQAPGTVTKGEIG